MDWIKLNGRPITVQLIVELNLPHWSLDRMADRAKPCKKRRRLDLWCTKCVVWKSVPVFFFYWFYTPPHIFES